MNTTLSSSNLASSGNRLSTSARTALAGMAGPILWCAVLLLLDIIQYDFLVSIGANPLLTAPGSENGMGPYGWLYVMSDFLLGVSAIVLAVGLHQSIKKSIWKYLGLGSLLLFGFGFVVGSTPCECIPGQQPGLSGQIHNIASLVLLLATIPMPFFTGIALLKDERWRNLGWYSILTGILSPVLFFVTNSLPPVFSWFYLWLLLIPFAWLEVISLRLWNVKSANSSHD